MRIVPVCTWYNDTEVTFCRTSPATTYCVAFSQKMKTHMGTTAVQFRDMG